MNYAGLEGRIRDLSRELLNAVIKNGQMDLAVDFAIPLPLVVIAEMLGIPAEDRGRSRSWNDMLLRMSYAVVGPPAPEIINEFIATTKEMNTYLTGLLDMRRKSPTDDLLTRLIQAEVDGERLTQDARVRTFSPANPNPGCPVRVCTCMVPQAYRFVLKQLRMKNQVRNRRKQKPQGSGNPAVLLRASSRRSCHRLV